MSNKFTPPSLSDDFYDKLEERIADENFAPRPIFKRHWLSLSAATIAAAAAVVIFATSTLHSGPQKTPNIAQQPTVPPEVPTTAFNPTLASQVLDRAKQAYSNIQGVSGTSTQTTYCVNDPNMGSNCKTSFYPVKQQTDFRIRANGDSWSHLTIDEAQNPQQSKDVYTSNAGSTSAYDASRNESISTSHYDPDSYKTTDALHYSKSTNDYYGMSKPYAFGHFTLQSLLDGLALDESSKLETAIIDGHTAWKISARGLQLDTFGETPDAVTAYFDQDTLFPLKVTETRLGQVFMETIVSNLQINPSFGDADFTLSIPKGVKVQTYDGPWKTTTLDSLSSKVSYKPLVPTTVPNGFTLLSVRYATDAGASGAEGMNMYNKDVVAMVYGRGLDTMTITTRLSGGRTDWEDPHGFEGEANAKATSITAKGGAYNDVKGNLVTGFGTEPHIWIQGATILTTIIGDVSAAELQTTLNSLQRQP